jgi:hypothetical protein
MDENRLRTLEQEKKRLAKLEQLKERQQDGLAARQEALTSALDRLGGLLEQLEQRLQPVLQDSELEGLPMEPVPMPPSPLAGFLRDTVSHAEMLGRRVGNLIGRVDL